MILYQQLQWMWNRLATIITILVIFIMIIFSWFLGIVTIILVAIISFIRKQFVEGSRWSIRTMIQQYKDWRIGRKVRKDFHDNEMIEGYLSSRKI